MIKTRKFHHFTLKNMNKSWKTLIIRIKTVETLRPRRAKRAEAQIFSLYHRKRPKIIKKNMNFIQNLYTFEALAINTNQGAKFLQFEHNFYWKIKKENINIA